LQSLSDQYGKRYRAASGLLHPMCIAKCSDPLMMHRFRLSVAKFCSLLAGTTSLHVLLAARQQRVGGPTKRTGGPDHQQRPRRTSEQPHCRFLACCGNRGQLDSLFRLILALCKVSLEWSCLADSYTLVDISPSNLGMLVGALLMSHRALLLMHTYSCQEGSSQHSPACKHMYNLAADC